MAAASAIAGVQTFREDVASRPGRVNGNVIRGVSVLRANSANGRRYTRECMRRAVREGVYEGRPVFDGHDRSGRERPPSEMVARVFGCRYVEEDDGPVIRGNLRVVKTHRLGRGLLEDAQDGGKSFSLSHNVQAEGKREGDTYVVERIISVESVDCVVDGGVNKGLYESANKKKQKGATMLIKLSEWIDRLASDPTRDRKVRKRLLEALDGLDDDMKDMEVTDPESPPPPDEDPIQMLARAAALLASSGDPAQHEMGLKVLKLLKPEAAAATEEDEGDDEGDDDDPTESRRRGKGRGKGRRPAALTEDALRDLCVLSGVSASAAVLESLKGLDAPQALSILRVIKAQQPANGHYRSLPRSQEPGAAVLSEGRAPEDPKQLGRWLHGHG